MPSDFPRSPKLLRGALAVYEDDAAGTQPQIIHFQYNPHSLRRRLEHSIYEWLMATQTCL